MRWIALIASLASLGAAVCMWPSVSASVELTIAAVLAICSWAPTPRRWYATAVVVTVAQSILTTFLWIEVAVVVLPDSHPGASARFWLLVAFASIATAASCLMAMRAHTLVSPVPRARARHA